MELEWFSALENNTQVPRRFFSGTRVLPVHVDPSSNLRKIKETRYGSTCLENYLNSCGKTHDKCGRSLKGRGRRFFSICFLPLSLPVAEELIILLLLLLTPLLIQN